MGSDGSLAHPLLRTLPVDLVVRPVAGVVGESAGTVYRARVCGRQRADGTWEGWMEFDPVTGGATLRTARETTQPNLHDLEYWATGLTPVYLEGALRRARDGREAEPVRPAGPETVPIGPVRGAVLDPFSVYVKGEALLRRQLAALSRDHLLAIVHAYELDDGVTVDTLTAPELIGLIIARVSERHAA
jgi:hypothetical protein